MERIPLRACRSCALCSIHSPRASSLRSLRLPLYSNSRHCLRRQSRTRLYRGQKFQSRRHHPIPLGLLRPSVLVIGCPCSRKKRISEYLWIIVVGHTSQYYLKYTVGTHSFWSCTFMFLITCPFVLSCSRLFPFQLTLNRRDWIQSIWTTRRLFITRWLLSLIWSPAVMRWLFNASARTQWPSWRLFSNLSDVAVNSDKDNASNFYLCRQRSVSQVIHNLSVLPGDFILRHIGTGGCCIANFRRQNRWPSHYVEDNIRVVITIDLANITL